MEAGIISNPNGSRRSSLAKQSPTNGFQGENTTDNHISYTVYIKDLYTFFEKLKTCMAEAYHLTLLLYCIGYA